MAPPRANGSSYDVFLSFRGTDTRHSFTDHLYNALNQAGILSFRDSDDAERGEELKHEIKRAIKASDASIIVLSENYATSTWCLDVLSLILEQRRDCNHFVLPLFYHVDPSDVGKHKGTFMIASNTSRRWTDENACRWKAALTEVVSVIGMSLVGPETIFIKKVVDTIYKRLDRKQIYIPQNIIGIDGRYKEIFNCWLKQPEYNFLIIYGMPGSGKSTLAHYIVYSYGQHYESNCIVEKIGDRCKNPHEMVILQQQLCNDISKGKERRIYSVCQGTAQIEVLLEKTKSLIVLDDIDRERQLEELLGSGNMNKDSKIIITTTNIDISNWFLSKSKKYHKHDIRLLDNNEALELLSVHAFRSKIPKDGYEELAQQVVQYCEGNPLALEVLGSSFSRKKTMAAWKSELRSFGKDIHGDIDVVLRRSYYSLTDLEKQLFLHIACFFVGKDMDDVVNILEPDYAAESKIKTLTTRCFLYVTPENKLMMHRLLQEMGRSLVVRESLILSERSRVWRDKDSYEILRRKNSSKTIEGLALDIKMLMKEEGFDIRGLHELTSDSLQRMDRLKFLKLNYVELTGSYGDLSEHLRWLCWVGFNKSTIHTDLFMGKLVALDMSYSCLNEFEPPMVLGSLKILNFKDSHNLLEIRNIDLIPNLETLILWNCHNLFSVCRNIENLERLYLLNMSGCKNLWKSETSFPLPHLLQRLFLDNCNLECTDYFPLSFDDHKSLQYINMGNGQFDALPSYTCLISLRVLDLRNCSRLKRLECLPNTLAELYIYNCVSIEKITFESGRFTLQEFGYVGCFKLCEIEGLLKLLLVSKLDEADLGHMNWVKEYQNQQVCLVGDYELTEGRSCYLQMLYEYNIMSISLPDINHPNLVPEYTSQSTSITFDVPCCPVSSDLRGLNVILRCKLSGEDWAWFAKISMTNGDDLIYNPRVFGRPDSGEVCVWLSYWPIGNLLNVGDEVTVSIVVMSGLEVVECGASLVYTDDDVAGEFFENKLGWVETVGKDLTNFQISNGSYYLCRRDFYKLMEVGRLIPGWLSSIVGDTIDDTEVRGWRMAGRPRQSYQSFTELKTVRCIIHYPETENETELDYLDSFPLDLQRLRTDDDTDKAHERRNVEGESGIKGVQPVMMDNLDMNSDLTRSFATSDDLGSYSDFIRSFATSDDSDSNSEFSRSFATSDSEPLALDEPFRGNFKNWQKGDLLGRGSFGNVYEGFNEFGFFFAVKEVSLLDQGNQGKQSIIQLEQEISLLSQFHHENIVQYLGTDKDDGKLYIFVELVAKGSLAKLYQKYHLPDSLVSAYTRQILSGLEYLHERTIVHRDIKCANILVDVTGSVKLADFALAKAIKFNDAKSMKGLAFWMAPEVVNKRQKGYGLKADIWSLGCTVLEMLTHRVPYQPLEVMPALFRIGRGIPPPIPNTLSAEAQDFIFRCLQKNPNDRPTAAQLLDHPFVKSPTSMDSSLFSTPHNSPQSFPISTDKNSPQF